MKHLFSACVLSLACLIALPHKAAAEEISGTQDPILLLANDYQIFVRLWRALPVNERSMLLEDIEQYTLLIPSDGAFNQMPINWLMEMMAPANRKGLRQFVARHIVLGAHSASDALAEQGLISLSGDTVVFTRQKYALRANNAYITRPNVTLPGGFAHVIDTVLDVGE